MQKMLLLLFSVVSVNAFANSGPGWSLVAELGNNKVILIDPAKRLDQPTYRSVEAQCRKSPKPNCRLIFWSDSAKAPKRFPITEDQANFQLAAFDFTEGNKPLGTWTWSCKLFTNMSLPTECFAGTKSKKKTSK